MRPMLTSGLLTVLTSLLGCGAEAAAPENPPETTEGAATVETNEVAPPAAQVVEAATLALGGTAPMASTTMRSVDGSMHSIASVAKEHGTLVVFTCNHCPYAIAWQDRLVALANEYLERGVGTIAINSNDPAEYPIDSYEGMQARAQELAMRFPYVVDETSDVARAFGAEKTPELYLFNGSGELVYHGAVDDSQDPAEVQDQYLRNALDAVVGGSAIAQAETRAIGCSIKFREPS